MELARPAVVSGSGQRRFAGTSVFLAATDLLAEIRKHLPAAAAPRTT